MLANLAQVQQKKQKEGQCHTRSFAIFANSRLNNNNTATIPYYVKM